MALDQRIAEVTRQVGVLEIGFVVRPRRQQHDVRLLVALDRRQRGETIPCRRLGLLRQFQVILGGPGGVALCLQGAGLPQLRCGDRGQELLPLLGRVGGAAGQGQRQHEGQASPGAGSDPRRLGRNGVQAQAKYLSKHRITSAGRPGGEGRGMNDKATVGAGVLYVVATPIGNLGDITARALETLRRVAVIAAEDTRHARHLLTHFGIQAELIAYHEHNETDSAPKLLARLEGGQDLALVSDAGTPLISDPGFVLVRMARERGLRVVPIPGANAAICALSAAGLPSDRFLFLGFPPAPPPSAASGWPGSPARPPP